MEETVGKKIKNAAANVGGVIIGVLEQASNGMDMMATNTNGDGKSLGERIKEKQAELKRRIAERDAKKVAAIKAAKDRSGR